LPIDATQKSIPQCVPAQIVSPDCRPGRLTSKVLPAPVVAVHILYGCGMLVIASDWTSLWTLAAGIGLFGSAIFVAIRHRISPRSLFRFPAEDLRKLYKSRNSDA
jgi:hypothetical protein